MVNTLVWSQFTCISKIPILTVRPVDYHSSWEGGRIENVRLFRLVVSYVEPGPIEQSKLVCEGLTSSDSIRVPNFLKQNLFLFTKFSKFEKNLSNPIMRKRGESTGQFLTERDSMVCARLEVQAHTCVYNVHRYSLVDSTTVE